MCGRDNYYDKRWHVPFGNTRDETKGDGKNVLERAIYRLTLLGVFRGYTVEYHDQSNGEFLIEPVQASGQDLRELVKERYLDYIRSYQSDAAFLDQSRRSLENAVEGIGDDREYILHVLRHLLANFTYKVIEEGRRRAIMTMLDAGRKASAFDDVEEAESFLRSQIVGYLSTSGVEDEEVGLNAILYDATDASKLVKVISHAISEKQEGAILQQSLRLLEDYPQHYGLYFVVAAIQAYQGKAMDSTRSVRSMVHFGVENYGLSDKQCAQNYMKFLESPSASSIGIEVLDKTLIALSETTGCSYGELIESIPYEKRRSIISIDKLDTIMAKIDKEMRWTTVNTEI